MHRVSCGMLVRSGRVLLAHRSSSKKWYPNVWDFPGGHVEPGENSREALARELREELGVRISITSTDMPVLTLRDEDTFLEVWQVRRWSGEIVNAAPEEHDEIGWFNPAEAKLLNLAGEEYVALFDEIAA